MAHGKLDDLEDRIDAFAEGRTDLLVATTVIENGIDMPNVNTIVVMHAERFGISQLYQLRGRVGRSDRQAYAYLCPNATNSLTVEAETRLEYMAAFTALGSGYDLSRRDMELRGHGTIFGTEQSGARDVGLDLESDLLSRAVQQMREQLIISAPDTRIELGFVDGIKSLEALGIAMLGPIPSEPAPLAQWETTLASAVLAKWIGGIVTSSSTSSSSSSYSGIALVRDDASIHVRALASANSPEELKRLTKEWSDKFGPLPSLVLELVARQFARIICRRTGIAAISVKRRNSNGIESEFESIECDCPGVSRLKWDSSLAKAVPIGLRDYVKFSEGIPSEENTLVSGRISIDLTRSGLLGPTEVTPFIILQTLIKVVSPLAAEATKRQSDKLEIKIH
jgi:hypothetical protein